MKTKVEFVRTPLEVQRVHDILNAILNERLVGVRFEPGETYKCANAVRDAFCWLLGHEDENGSFEDNLNRWEDALREAGYNPHPKPVFPN